MEGRQPVIRVVIEGVTPEIDSGRFPAKRCVGDEVVVEADIFADGHDVLSAALLHRREGAANWAETLMEPLPNDRWRASFRVSELGFYCYTIMAWVDQFKSWRRALQKKVEAGQEVGVDFLTGARHLADVLARAKGQEAEVLQRIEKQLRATDTGEKTKVKLALSNELLELMDEYGGRGLGATYPKELRVKVDREKARFSTWYEMFPRSTGAEAGRHGTFKDCERRLPYIADMGFDVLYLPPIHPIATTNRKGKNNARVAGPGDPGTPWAIGSTEGGHMSVHPDLGSLDDLKGLVAKAAEYGIEIALDIAFQCSPDHPYIQAHPEWFLWRPDGTLQYAENPPKKYEDIYPLNFDTAHAEDLWNELKSVIDFWIDQGIRIFRVDNPHTKPFVFWEWLIDEFAKQYPDLIFLAEAFTRPKIMYRLAKLGFTQSYTYFAWRNAKWELTQYFTELTKTEVWEFFRPNLWPNTPDILTEYLQNGGRPAFMARLVLAATLGSSYGIYGPAFELCEAAPREPGSEEYLDSEKYELKHWEIDRQDSLKDFVGRTNRIRRDNAALRDNCGLEFHPVDNEQIICYSKKTEDLSNVILVVVNLDPHHTQSGWVEFPLDMLGLPEHQTYQVHDLLTGARYLWTGRRNYVELDPHVCPAHILRVLQKVRNERSCDY
jgi:starch synthase (maltosyl-transferring)